MIHKLLHISISRIMLCCAALLPLFCACNNTPEPQPATIAGHTTLEDLEGHSVAVIEGSTSDVLLSDSNNFSNITLVRCPSPTDIISAVESGKADCGITDTVVLMTLDMEKHGLAIDFNLPGGFDVAAAFNPADKELCNKFNDFLVQIKSDGTLEEMLARWSNPTPDTIIVPNMPELANLKGHPLEVATMIDNPPFSFYKDNIWTGFEVEMIMRFSIFINRPVHFSGYNFNEIIGILLDRKADIAAANMFITPDRADQVRFSTPYYLCKTSCFSKAR